MMEENRVNPLGSKPVSTLLRQFAIPSIIAMLVGSLYNIVDQIFIGNSVGQLGNAATNVAFPMTTISVATALLFGIGGSACFNLYMGKGEKEKALHYYGNALVAPFIMAGIVAVLAEIFMVPMLRFFGSPDAVLSYAVTYTSITAIGLPFVTLATAGGHLIRADGSPRFTMTSNLSGAIINTILDPILIFGFNMGMAGAAIATIIGQIFSAGMVVYYMRFKFKSGHLCLDYLMLKFRYLKDVISLGMTPFLNQLALMVVQIVMNNSLTYYGRMSSYGEEVPLACVGIITKVTMLYFSICIGLSQGMQPIASFNYGAKQYGRVREVLMKAINSGFLVSTVAFGLFQIFPRQIISLFGKGSPEYVAFAVRYFRIFLFFTFCNNLQPIASNFFTSIGKPKKGVFLSLTRQIIFLLPMIIILPMIMGIDGIMYAGPIADCLAALLSILMVRREMQLMPK